MLVVRAYGIRGKNRDNVPENQRRGKVSFTINAAGQVHKQTIEFVYLGGAITADIDLSIYITRSLQRAWACFQLYKMEINDRPGVRLRLKVRLLKAVVVETLLYGCMTWSLNKPDYDRLRRVHHSMLLRCLGWWTRKCDNHTLSYADVLAKTASESIEAMVRKRRILFAGYVARMGGERLPQRVMFGELVEGEGYSEGQEKNWIAHLKEDISVFEMKFEGWRKAAQKAGRWFRRVEEGAALFMPNWHETERRKAAERRAKAAAAPSTVGISKRPGGGGRRGGGRGGVMPERLKSGFDHHRLESCGPSNGRHKIA